MPIPRETRFSPETRESWHDYIADFRQNIYPIVAEHGISLGEALMLIKLQSIANLLEDLKNDLRDDDA